MNAKPVERSKIGNDDGNPPAPLAGTTDPHVGAEYEVRLIQGEVRYFPLTTRDT